MKSYTGLSFKKLKYDKRNTIFIFITVVLSIALFISTFITTRYNMKVDLHKLKEVEGNYDVRLLDINQENMKQLEKAVM